ncbi:hypothetical protein VOLCADRAFT_115928, partial [Volvox carteri f. nagariensis]
DKGLKCKINVPDTVLFRYGQLSAWWATNKEGYIQRHASHNTTMEAIRRRFIQVAECDEANYSKYVVVVRAGDGHPQLLRLQAFNQLTEMLSDRLEAGNLAAAPEVDSLQVLQAFVQPHNDLRYVTTYVASGANNITCHTFQRKYSRRYVAQGSTLPPGADDAFVNDSSFACGKIYLQSVLRTEWATNAYGNGGGSLGAANLTGEPLELEDGTTPQSPRSPRLPPPPPPPPLGDGGDETMAPVTEFIRPAGVPGVGAGSTMSSLAAFPGGGRAAGLSVSVTNTWPSHQHENQLGSGAVTARSAAGTASGGLQPLGAAGGGGGGGGGGGRIQSARSALGGSSVMADRGGGGSAATRPARPGSSPVAFGRNSNTSPLRSSSLAPGPTPGIIPNTGLQLTRDLEAARDQLLIQNQLAEASAAKVRQLEREKELLVAAFDHRVSELQSSLLVARQDLNSARQDAEEQRKRATEAEARITELEVRAHSLQSTLDGERGTVMTALKECHERDVSVKRRAEQLEAEVQRLTERLKEETTAVAALKRQLLQFSDIAERYATTLREGEMEPGMQEVLDRVQKLFVGQTNPFGESYAVQKVLNHYHGDLRAVFLYYAQLENNFAAYWPPSLAFQQWMLFCKETETSDPRSNSRVSAVTQPHKMLHPRDCEAVFRAYAKLDPNAINTAAPVLTYEGFLSAIIDVSFRVKRFDNPYLSEAVREYILSYVSRASKMSPTGLRRGQVRDALEGTKEGPPPSPGGPHLAPTKSMTRGGGAAAKKKAATIASSVHEYPLVRTMTGLIRTTTGTSAGGSLAASRPSSALSRKNSIHQTALEQDLALEVEATRSVLELLFSTGLWGGGCVRYVWGREHVSD